MKTLSCGSLIELCTTRNSSCYYINLLSGSLNKLFTNGSCLSGFDQSAHTYSSRSKSGKNESWITGLKRKWINYLQLENLTFWLPTGIINCCLTHPLIRFHQNTFTFVTRRPSVAPRDLKSFVYARLASFSLTERGLTKLLKSP